VPREEGARPLGPPSPQPGGRPSPPAPVRRRGGAAHAAALVGLVLVVVGLGLAAWGMLGAGSSGEPVRVVIPTGAGVGRIAEILDAEGIVPSAFLFEARATVGGRRSELKAGTYSLPRGAPHDRVVDALAAGPAPIRPRVVQVTIPEGRSRREIAPLVEDAGLDGSYARASRRSPVLDPADYGAEDARDLEGFLFPSTYEVRADASARALVRRQVQAFAREWEGVDMRAARRRNLTPYDVLIVASMVEREAQVAKERPLIASVIYNRLRDGEPLGIDATVRYAVRNWSQPLTRSELAVPSPYNTRLNAGLPPGPIGNPGLASIEAAARPADTDYRFYVVKPNTCGEHSFSETQAEFLEDSRRYDEARAAAGGRSPDSC
jgi:uncharacterized YceG family protein